MDFSFDDFVKDLPPPVTEALVNEAFTTLPSLQAATQDDIESLPLKRGHIALLRDAVFRLTNINKSNSHSQDKDASCSKLLGGITISDRQKENTATPAGMVYRIVDFVSTSLFADEEINLTDGVTLKVNTKIKLEKVSPAIWITANSRILQAMMTRHQNMNVAAYLRYTEMVGELAARYTWQSVMLFDDEYRQRQAKMGFEWGTETPHLSTVMLRDRENPHSTQPRKSAPGSSFKRQYSNELCRQFNRGSCTYGAMCRFGHSCALCGSKDHSGKDHTNSSTLSNVDSSRIRGGIVA